MPDIESASQAAPAGPPPIVHPMDPRRGENLSPMFAALLCWLLQLPPMTNPAITGVVVAGGCVFAATTNAPFHDTPCSSSTQVLATPQVLRSPSTTPAARRSPRAPTSAPIQRSG